MKSKRLLSILLTLGLSITATPINAYAGSNATGALAVEYGKEAAKEELSEETMKMVLTAVKEKINIPAEYSEFSYYYDAYGAYNNTTWTFQWGKEDGSSRIYISSDNDGNIMSYHIYGDSERSQVPTYLKAELKNKADKFVKQVAANIYDKLKYENAEYIGSFNGYYRYYYVRMENDVPMPDQQVSVGIDAKTGEVISYENDRWNYGVEIPKKNIKLTKEQAVKKIREQLKMDLIYVTRYKKNSSGKEVEKAYLVYQPSMSYIAVDAIKGTTYTTKTEWNSEYAMDTAKESSTAGGLNRGAMLTAEELGKAAELGDLISKDKAIDIVRNNKSLYQDATATTVSASLSEDNNYDSNSKKRYVWNLTMENPKEPDYANGDYYRAYITATVDAKTGEIVYYNASVKDYYSNNSSKIAESAKFTKEESRKIFEKFVKTQNKDRFAATELSDTTDRFVINVKNGTEVYGGYYLNYNRVNEGISYSGNQIYGSVDAVTGKIVSYGYYWNDALEFQSPKGIITEAAAYEAYMNLKGFDLVYELNTIMSSNSFTQEARLVYRTDITPSYISPFTGKQITYSGEEYVETEEDRNYVDIKNNKFYRSIQLLADMGGGPAGDNFYPDKVITREELQQMVDAVTYMEEKEKLSTESTITRQEAAMYAMDMLELGYLAELKEIYVVGSKDEEKISDKYRGAAALSVGLRIFSLDEAKNFRPEEKLTRAEAADMIIKVLAAEK